MPVTISFMQAVSDRRGGAGIDTIDGGAGDDIIDGGVGADKMWWNWVTPITWITQEIDSEVVSQSSGGFDTVIPRSMLVWDCIGL